jgi:hypothetical protein
MSTGEQSRANRVDRLDVVNGKVRVEAVQERPGGVNDPCITFTHCLGTATYTCWKLSLAVQVVQNVRTLSPTLNPVPIWVSILSIPAESALPPEISTRRAKNEMMCRSARDWGESGRQRSCRDLPPRHDVTHNVIAQSVNSLDPVFQLGQDVRQALCPSLLRGLVESLFGILARGTLVNVGKEHVGGKLFLQELDRLLLERVGALTGVLRFGLSDRLGLLDVPLQGGLSVPDEGAGGVFALLVQLVRRTGREEQKVRVDRGHVNERDERVGEGLGVDRGGSQ